MQTEKDKPCNFDHNGECLICDCWSQDCAWQRLIDKDYKYESKEQLDEMFKEFKTKELMKTLDVIKSGYAGVLSNGNIVDRREHPAAIPIPENPLFNTPKPKNI